MREGTRFNRVCFNQVADGCPAFEGSAENDSWWCRAELRQGRCSVLSSGGRCVMEMKLVVKCDVMAGRGERAWYKGAAGRRI